MILDELFEEEFFDEEFFQADLSDILETPSNRDIITESDLKAFFRCPYSYFLKNHAGLSKVPRSAFGAQSLFFQHARHRLFNLRDPKIGRLLPFQDRAGPELKTAEEMDKKELRKYLASTSPTALGNSLKMTWLRIAEREFYAGNLLLWHFTQQPGKSANQLQKAGKHYYEFVLDHGAPILGFQDYKACFDWQGHKFRVKFPEIRKGLYLDDPTLWGFNSNLERGKGGTLPASSLVTLRILGYCQLVSQYNLFRLKCGVDEKTLTDIDQNSISERITYRHLNGEKNILSSTTRNHTDLGRLDELIESFLEQTAQEQFAPNHKQCPSCPYNSLNLNGEPVCRKVRKGSKPAVPAYYLKDTFHVDVVEEENKITLNGMVRNKKIIKDVCQYVLDISDVVMGGVQVNSHYQSQVHGSGFEDQILNEADKRLQERANQSRLILVHKVNFQEDFKYDGQNKIIETLKELGYFRYKKKYSPK